MKMKIVGYYVIFAVLIMLSACGTGGQQGTIEPEQTEINGEVVAPVEEASEGETFRNIKVTGDQGEYVVTGEANVFAGVFYYAVEEGHEYVVEETQVTVENSAPNWESFELKISVPEDSLPVNGTLTLELYELSPEDNSIVNLQFIKLDEFGY